MNERGLIRRIGLGHGIALYVSAILGAGVLVLPGQIASLAGPASLVSWAFGCLMGIPLAVVFTQLARRYPDAGGVATYVTNAFGPTWGGLAGWLYFVAGSVGQTIVPLTGGYYLTEALALPTEWAYLIAALILGAATATNLVGVRLGAGVQLSLAAAVAAFLLTTMLLAIPRLDADRLVPFAPHGLPAIGAGVVVLFFAFAGWEAVAHLAAEFRDPQRDLPRAIAATVVVITVLYVGTAAAVVLTGTYGSPETDRVAIALLLQQAFGDTAVLVAAVGALLISLATTNAFIAGVSRLAYSLAGAGWLPPSVGVLDRRGLPTRGVLAVSATAAAGLVFAAVFGWGTERLVVLPSVLVVTVYLLAASAATKLLSGIGRFAAVATVALTMLVVPSVAANAAIPVLVGLLALAVRRRYRRRTVESA